MTDEIEPDSSLTHYCPHCAEWFNPNSKTLLSSDQGLLCPNHDYSVVLLNAHHTGVLTPWQEWKKSTLVEEMNKYLAMAADIKKELDDYYFFSDNNFC